MTSDTEILSVLSDDFASANGIRDILASSARALLSVIRASFCHAALAQGELITMIHSESLREHSWESHLGDTFSRVEAPAIWSAIETGELSVARLSKAPSSSKASQWGGLLDPATRSVLVVPLVSRSRSFGALIVGEVRSWDRESFSPAKIALTKAVASHTVLALDRSYEANERQSTLVGAIRAMSLAVDAKSPWTAGHSERVARYAVALGTEIGLEPETIQCLSLGGLLHDIGKLGVCDSIVEKPGKLTPEEFEAIKSHSARGCLILAPVSGLSSILPVVRSHHERWDGRGYPDGLAGSGIPLSARIMAIADTYDAMTATRPYRTAPGHENAIEELKRCAGSQFDPHLVDPFVAAISGERDGDEAGR